MQQPHLSRFAADTHCGRKYQHNEDSIGWDTANGLYFVADGMGGHASGEIASDIVKQTLLAQEVQTPLDQALVQAHRAVVSAASASDTVKGMGSTAVVARVRDGQCRIAWVGDSRAYLFRRGELRLLTRDHSYVELLLAQGNISEEDARSHPDRNLVTQTLGIADPVPSQTEIWLRPGDRLLLCSDGLNDELTDNEIAGVLRSHADPKEAVSELIHAALAKGGRDNISAIVIEPFDAHPIWRRVSTPLMANGVWLPVLIGWVAAVFLFVLWYGMFKS
jgi:PPM family protein phosphatase